MNFTTSEDTGPINNSPVDQPVPAAAPTQCQILLTDSPEGMTVEMRSTNIADIESPANLMCAFLAKYWEVMCSSMMGELKQAQAELSGKPIERAPLRLVDGNGAALVAQSSDAA